MNEIKIHKSLDHNNIVQFKHQFEDNDNVYLLIDLCVNKTMSEMIKRRKRLSEFEVRCLTRQICEGVKYLRQKRVIHRDLKLGNLFIND